MGKMREHTSTAPIEFHLCRVDIDFSFLAGCLRFVVGGVAVEFI